MTRQVIVLFGGESRERMVSVASAQNLAKALPHATYWFWDPDGQIHIVNINDLLSHVDPFRAPFVPKGAARWPTLLAALDEPATHESVIFNAIHGGLGENGTVQKWLEERGIRFTGPGSRACHLAFDKILGKKVMSDAGARVAESIVLDGHNLPEAEHALRNFVRTHRKVAFKPVADGSSYGLIIIDDDTKLAEALKQLEESPQTPQLVETFIEGTELSVGVIDDADGPRALPGTEIRVQQGQLFGYDEKYLMSGVEMTPPEVPEAIIHAGQRLAVAAHTAFGCVGYSRVDLIVDDHGAVFLELNTLPGLTASSMVPAQLAAKGMSLHAFCERQITLAESRTSFRASQNNP